MMQIFAELLAFLMREIHRSPVDFANKLLVLGNFDIYLKLA